MDGRKFDALTRALGAGTSRRSGLRAMLGAAVALAGGLPAASAKRGDPPPAAGRRGPVGTEGPCKSTRRKDNTCTSDGECCSKFCDIEKGKGNKDKLGRCRCKNKNQPCNLDINCCKRRGQQMSCNRGRCSELIPTMNACRIGGWACRDAGAACTTYVSGIPAGLYCLFGVNQQCTVDAQCTTGLCLNGACRDDLVPTTHTCVVGGVACRDASATCTRYIGGEPGGDHCLFGVGQQCTEDAQCTTGRCQNGVCRYQLIPTTQRCEVSNGPDCEDPNATCTNYVGNVPSGLRCLLGLNEQCVADAECTSGLCQYGRCRYQITVNCGTAGANTCDRRGSCTTYRDGSPAGAYCLLPGDAVCERNNECESQVCAGGRCATGVPTSISCTSRDFCKDAAASCVEYTDVVNGRGDYCLLPDGEACEQDADCVNAYCSGGYCDTCTDAQTGEECATNDDCCSGFCSVVNGKGRCIGKKTVWALLSWTTAPTGPDDSYSDLDTWVWMPQSVPQASSDQFGSIFPNGGDVVMYSGAWYPLDDVDPDNGDVPDAWLDVDDTDTPGLERFLWFKPVPRGTYRYAVKNYQLCPGDDGSTSSCGSSWNKIEDDFAPFLNPNYDTQVTFYVYTDEIRKFVLPWSKYGSDTTSHYYWWQVTDLTFDENGWFKEFTTPNNTMHGLIRNCAPVMYPGNVGGESSNICPYGS